MQAHQGSLLISLLLLGTVCGAAPPAYQEPGDEPSAKVRITLTRPKAYAVHLTGIDLAKCKSAATIGWLSGGAKLEEHRVGMLGSSPPQEGILERRVRAGTPLAWAPTFVVTKVGALEVLFAFNTYTQNKMRKAMAGKCRTPIFTPEAGAEYELTIDMSPGDCSVKLEQLAADTGESVLRTEVAVPTDQFTVNAPLQCPK